MDKDVREKQGIVLPWYLPKPLVLRKLFTTS